MYIPAHFTADESRAIEAMRAHPFALLASAGAEGAPFATHCPLVVSADARTLRGHLARANPHWQYWEREPRVLAVFPGPHAYISPSLYASRQAVPTWNYVAVHVQGRVRCVHDEAGKCALIDELIAANEPAHAAQWAQQSAQFAQAMLAGIVGFEIAVERIEGKFKLSQNRPAQDRATVAQAMRAGGADEQALAQWMERLGIA